jgi:hypothetical protein
LTNKNLIGVGEIHQGKRSPGVASLSFHLCAFNTALLLEKKESAGRIQTTTLIFLFYFFYVNIQAKNGIGHTVSELAACQLKPSNREADPSQQSSIHMWRHQF